MVVQKSDVVEKEAMKGTGESQINAEGSKQAGRIIQSALGGPPMGPIGAATSIANWGLMTHARTQYTLGLIFTE